MTTRADRHNNPTAMITSIARQGGLILGKDYEEGDQFPNGVPLYTARLLHDPIELTIRVIDKVGFYNVGGAVRWIYIALPKFVWDKLGLADKMSVIKFMYQHEGGVELLKLFP